MFVIAGANGHVGFVAAHKLLAAGQKVRVIVHANNRKEHWEEEGAEVAVGSLDDEAFLTQTLKGADGFFTLTPPNFGIDDYTSWQHKVADANAAAVRASGVPHVVLLSLVGAQHKQGTGPIKGLHYFEQALRNSGAKLRAIRASHFQENIASAIAAAENAGIFPNLASSDEHAVPMIATKDIGELVAEELMRKWSGSEIVDLIGPSYSPRDLAQKVGKAIGHEDLPIVRIPREAHVSTMVGAGVPQNFAVLLAELIDAGERGLLEFVGDRSVQGKTPIDDVIRAMTAQLHHH